MNSYHEKETNGFEPEKTDEQRLSDWTFIKFKDAMVAKDKIAKDWRDYIDAYNGEYFKDSTKADYKSNQVSNMIYSVIESIRPIMADERPRFEVLPRTKDGLQKADLCNKALDYEFDRTNMRSKILKQLHPTLQLGTSIFFVHWNADKGVDGEVECTIVNPFNFYVDPLASNIEDAEYVIYATYKHVNQLKQLFPNSANLLEGGNIKYSELIANREQQDYKTDTQILVLETWCRDYTYIDIEEEEYDGQKVTKRKRKYPNGRVITTAPELTLVLSDKENPYEDGKFPFVIMKDIDVPFEFWGKGEIEQILSPQIYINELNNQIIDNAKNTANMQWILDKNCGIGQGKLSNRPGLVIRKNPGSEVKRDAPPPMPNYVRETITELKTDIENISGVHDVTQGKRPSGIQAGNAILALQEAGQSRIRLKVQIMEEALTKVAQLWYSRMKQFWIKERWIRIADDQAEGGFNFVQVDRTMFDEEFDIQIKTGSTLNKNKNALLDLFIRLSQTMAEDGMPMVDRETVLEYTPIPNKRELVKKFDSIKENQAQQQIEQANQMLAQERQMFAEQVGQLNEAIQEVAKQLVQLNKDVDKIEQEHESIKEQERLTDMSEEAYQRGAEKTRQMFLDEMDAMSQQEQQAQQMQEQQVQQMQQAQPVQQEGELDDELLTQLNNMSPEELADLVEMYPELAQMIQEQAMQVQQMQQGTPQQMQQMASEQMMQ